jgi:hypothetical protein
MGIHDLRFRGCHFLAQCGLDSELDSGLISGCQCPFVLYERSGDE